MLQIFRTPSHRRGWQGEHRQTRSLGQLGSNGSRSLPFTGASHVRISNLSALFSSENILGLGREVVPRMMHAAGVWEARLTGNGERVF
jgi:hypothetical protein